MLRSLPLPSGRAMPVLGQGTWSMGEQRGAFDAEDRRAAGSGSISASR